MSSEVAGCQIENILKTSMWIQFEQCLGPRLSLHRTKTDRVCRARCDGTLHSKVCFSASLKLSFSCNQWLNMEDNQFWLAHL